jgi:hypothetical protein
MKEVNGTNGTSKSLTVDGGATATIPMPIASPVTPTPATFHPPPAQVTIPEPQDATLATPIDKLSFSHESLSSSRPAPPSPAASRRASSTLSGSVSRARSRPQSHVHSFLESEHRAEGSSSTVVPATRPAPPIKIRDFAFPLSDERHIGNGPDVPRANARNRSSTYSSSSSACSDEDEEAEEEQRHNSFSSFRWNTLSSQFYAGKDTEDDASVPSKTDFDRNFEQASPIDEDADEDYDYPPDDELLIPGKYRALYAFEPEGTAEMALEEEQLVHVVGRGGGVGWAIVEREGGGHALVPESYLELVQPDTQS